MPVLRRALHASRRVADNPGHQHPAFQLARATTLNSAIDKVGRIDAPNSKMLLATRALRAGDSVHRFLACGGSETEASQWTLQVDARRHLSLAHHVFRHICHACEPNVRMRGVSFEAHRDIARGEELTLDLNASELKLINAFRCKCGAAACVGMVRGWADLNDSQRALRRDRCQPWLLFAEPRNSLRGNNR